MKGKGPDHLPFEEGSEAKGQKPGKQDRPSLFTPPESSWSGRRFNPNAFPETLVFYQGRLFGFQRHQIQALIGHDSGERKSVTTVYTHVMDKPKVDIVVAVIKTLPPQVRNSIADKFGRSN